MKTNNLGIEEQQIAARRQLSENIVDFIESNGISVFRFSQLAKMSQSQIQLIIDGKTNPTLDVLTKISAVIGKKIEINAI